MKGVIVQTGNPKSIVLLNNGRVTSIPTPQDETAGEKMHFFHRKQVQKESHNVQ